MSQKLNTKRGHHKRKSKIIPTHVMIQADCCEPQMQNYKYYKACIYVQEA